MVSKTRSDTLRRRHETINHSHDKTHSNYPEGETTPTCTSCPVAKYSDISSSSEPCSSCSIGFTTTSTGSTSASQCICDVGYYLDGSSCTSCGSGTTTSIGSTSASQCICDVGYYLDGSSCTSCGIGSSDLFASNSLLLGSSSSEAYIDIASTEWQCGPSLCYKFSSGSEGGLSVRGGAGSGIARYKNMLSRIDGELTIEATIEKDSGCDDHFIYLSTSPSKGFNFGTSSGRVLFVWDCGTAKLYSTSTTESKSCSSNREYTFTVKMTATDATWTINGCGTLTESHSLGEGPYYLFVGADTDSTSQTALFKSLTTTGAEDGSHTTISTGSTSASQCICNVGYYLDGSSCVSCPEYSSPPSTSGLTSVSQCRCNAGYSLAASSCTACDSGKWSDTVGANTCIDCSAGRFKNQTGSNSPCLECEVGTYAAHPGQSVCSGKCPSHLQYSKWITGATSEEQLGCVGCLCSLGYICGTGENMNECDECPIGKFADTVGGEVCRGCEPGKYAPVNGSAACIFCEPGEIPSDDQSRCLKCSIGTIALPGQPTCTACNHTRGLVQPEAGKSHCNYCGPGLMAVAGTTNDCVECEAGHASLGGSDKCDPCNGDGSYAPAGSSFCLVAFAGTQPNAERSGVERCPINTFSLGGSNKCEDCPEGKFSNYGELSCDTCGPGTFFDEDWDGPGHGRRLEETDDEIERHGIEEHRRLNDCGSGEAPTSCASTSWGCCDTCPSGSYRETNFCNECCKCRAGRYMSTNNNQASSCTACSAGRYSLQGAAGCTVCSSGRYSSSGSSSCSQCPAGKIPNSLSSACNVCPENTYANRIIGASECLDCPSPQVSNAGSISCGTLSPSSAPSISPAPSSAPSSVPSEAPSVPPTQEPSEAPSNSPTLSPSGAPSFMPSAAPSLPPTLSPSLFPSVHPSESPR